jgi:hypothetical protein
LLEFLFLDDRFRLFELSDDASNVEGHSDQINLARCIDVIDEAHGLAPGTKIALPFM